MPLSWPAGAPLPAYLAANEPRRSPEDLTARHLLLIESGIGHEQTFIGPEGDQRSVHLVPYLSSSSGEVVHDWALAGLGLEIRSELDLAEDLTAGRLVRVMPDWRIPGANLHAVFPARRHIPERVRRLLDAVAKALPDGRT